MIVFDIFRRQQRYFFQLGAWRNFTLFLSSLTCWIRQTREISFFSQKIKISFLPTHACSKFWPTRGWNSSTFVHIYRCRAKVLSFLEIFGLKADIFTLSIKLQPTFLGNLQSLTTNFLSWNTNFKSLWN